MSECERECECVCGSSIYRQFALHPRNDAEHLRTDGTGTAAVNDYVFSACVCLSDGHPG